MKAVHYFGLILSILIVFTLCGCRAPTPVVKPEKEVIYQDRIKEVKVPGPSETMMPLTPAILQRLRDTGEELGIDERIKKYQFRLVGRILLEREYPDKNDRYLGGGIAGFENIHIKETIVISDQTDGQAVTVKATRNETILQVCFEDDDSLNLIFYTEESDPNGFFYLDYTPTDGLGEENGSLVYDGKEYKLKFGDRRPYLLIKLSQKDVDRVNSRTAAGRTLE